MIEIRCPGCERKLRIQDSAAGEVRSCPACSKQFRVPRSRIAEEEQPARTGVKSAPHGQLPPTNGFRPPSPQRPTAPVRQTKPPPEPEEDDDVYEDLQIVPAKRPKAKEAPEPEERARPPKKTVRQRRPLDEDEEARDDRPKKTMRRRRPLDDDEDEPREEARDEDEDRPRKRRKKKRKNYLREEPSGLDPFIFVIIGLASIWLLMTVSALFIPFLGAILGSLGVLVAIGARIWILVIASQEGDLRNCLVIPFYELYFVIASIGETWRAAAIYLIGIVMLVSGIILWPHDFTHNNYRNSPPPSIQRQWDEPNDWDNEDF